MTNTVKIVKVLIKAKLAVSGREDFGKITVVYQLIFFEKRTDNRTRFLLFITKFIIYILLILLSQLTKIANI